MSPPTVDLRTELVVLSHLRWDWVWQRPQHLISRLARGRRTWFVEEPRSSAVDTPRLVCDDVGGLTRVRLEVPGGLGRLDFGAAGTERYADLLADLLPGSGEALDCWLYTPLALPIAESLLPRLLVYDVMDDLASFAAAPEGLVLLQRRALEQADVVFTGGRSLYRGVLNLRSQNVYLFPSGVELAHYRASRSLRRPHPRPVAGFVGVVDERLDLPLLAELAERLPDWDVAVVGPVTKVDPRSLPQADNLHYLGMQPYDRLPEVMAGFDVALMPFARNEATRSISPTKTLEYLAAGLPVVSTRVPDVVADFGTVVHLADDAAEFAAACRHVLSQSRPTRDRRVAPLVKMHQWDAIAADMAAILEQAVVLAAAGSETA
ncbi:MAG: glycosyltransferase [Mycobacteriales bacterium]